MHVLLLYMMSEVTVCKDYNLYDPFVLAKQETGRTGFANLNSTVKHRGCQKSREVPSENPSLLPGRERKTFTKYYTHF